jgi:DNA polymerase III epsilon subunit-like protein
MVKICVFDTETTGLPPVLDGKDWNERNNNDQRLLSFDDLSKSTSVWNKILHSWPSIIQLSYIIYDMESPNNSKIFNKYIDIPDNITIADTSIAIHHIDKEKIKRLPTEKKALISDAVAEFVNDIMKPDVIAIVGHNIQFDRKMIVAELLRLKNLNIIDSYTEKQLQFLMNNQNFVCTMDATAPVCNIQIAVNYKDKKTGMDKVFYKVKSPKLIESYQYYFGYLPDSNALHDSLIDVILCLRVFMKYKYDIDVCGKNTIITEYIKKISPENYGCDLEPENIKLEMFEVDPFEIENENEKEKSTLSSATTPTKKKTGGKKKTKKTKKTKLRRSKRRINKK